MEMKEKALKLADDMEVRAKIRRSAKDRKSVQENSNDRISDQLEQASTMIRRLVEELNKKRLSDEEIDKLADEYLSDYFNMQETINFVKAIEERHGIK